MKYNTQNAKISSITEKTLIVVSILEVRRTSPAHSTGVTMNTQRSLLNSATTKKVSGLSRPGWRNCQQSMAKPKTIAGLVNEGRSSSPYIPTGVYAEIRNLSNLRFQSQEELTRAKKRLDGWLNSHIVFSFGYLK